MIHYIRDAVISYNGESSYKHDYWRAIVFLYHFLRVMGWTRLYEGSGTSTINVYLVISDGNMEGADTSSWTAYGTATLAKDTTTKHQSTKSLKITSNASGDGVTCTAYEAPGTGSNTYHVRVWAANDSGASWQVQVDNGGGSFASVGSIPDNNGVWTEYEFTYTRSATANNYVRIVDNNNTQTFIHIDDLHVWRSFWEDSAYEEGTDGDVVNGNEFESAGYTFDTGDVNHFLIFYDPTNLGNSGCYKITSINAGNAVLDLRVGGAETLTNTTSQDLAWRIYDPDLGPISDATEDASAAEYSRVLLQSPHASNWRLGFRLYHGSAGAAPYVFVHAAPEDCPYGISGYFSWEGQSVGQDQTYLYTSQPQTTSARTGRFYAMVDDDQSFVTWAHRWSESSAYLYPYCVVGHVSDDTEFTEKERWAFLAARSGPAANEQGILDDSSYSFAYRGVCATEGGVVIPAAVGILNLYNVEIVNDTDCVANPYSSEEWVIPMVLLRGITFDTEYGECDMDREDAFLYTRANMANWATFNSNNHFHLCNGIVWPWPGVSVAA